MPEPTKITGIIPAGQPLPPRPPEPGEIPPWRTAPAVPPPPAPPPPPALPPTWAWPHPPSGPAAPIAVHVTVDMVLPIEEPPPVPPWYRRAWGWITYRTSPYAAILALAASVAPIPGIGYGIGPIWGSFLYTVRTTTHPIAGYVIGLGAILIAGRNLIRADPRRGAGPLFLLSVSTVGAIYGAFHPLDIVTALTGVPTS